MKRKPLARLALTVIALLFAASLLLPLAAFAWCTAIPPANPASGPPPVVPSVIPPCWPAAAGLGGSGKGYLRKDIAPVLGATVRGGSALGWWCPNPDNTWSAYSIACLDKYCPGTAFAAISAALSASSPSAALQNMLNSYTITPTDWSEINDYNCLHLNMWQALEATKPSTAVSYVANGGTIFTAAGGRITGVTTKKAAPGAPLDCALTKVTNTTGGVVTDYCALVGGSPSEVTQVKKP